MTDKPNEVKQALKDVLNIRVDSHLSTEIDRIAAFQGTSASDAARKLLQYGIEVARKLEADDLMRPYWSSKDNVHDYDNTPMYRVAEITAKWRWERDEGEPW